MEFDAVRAWASHTLTVGKWLRDSNDTASVGWGVRIRLSNHVRLKTGGELKDIEGSIYVRPGTATPEGMNECEFASGQKLRLWGMLQYNRAIESEFYNSNEQYRIYLYPSRATFDEIVAWARLGRFPFIEVSLGDDGVTDDQPGTNIGWEPDGSGLDWDNKDYPKLKIYGCEFKYDLGEKLEDENGNRIPTVEETVRNSLASVNGSLRTIAITVGILLVVVLVKFVL